MGFEKHVLNVVSEVTDTPAYFYEGTLFLATDNSQIAAKVFRAIWNKVTAGVCFQKVGAETAYDFLV